MTIRVVVADDHELVRTGFRTILDLQDDIEVVGEAADGREAIAVVGAVHPDVVLMDVRMPVLDGIEATRQVSGVTRVLILTTFDLDEHVYAALRAGASGFLLKDVRRDELVDAVRVVAGGNALLAPSVTRRLLAEFASRDPARADTSAAAVELLTMRERDVLGLVARGRSNAEIAAELRVGEETVKTHVAHVLMKLALRDRVQAVIFAYEVGFVSPGSSPEGGTPYG